MNTSRLAALTVSELKDMARMAQDAIDEGSPETPNLIVALTTYNALIALREKGSDAPAAPIVEDEVKVGRQAGSPAANQYGTFAVHTASEAQVRFLSKLLAEKDTTGVKVPTTLDGISKTAASALIDRLMDRPAKPGAGVPASEKQLALINKLYGEKSWAGVVNVGGLEIEVDTDKPVPTNLTGGRDGSASKVIDALFAAPKRQAAPKIDDREIVAGAYRVGEKIVCVYLGQQSGRMLAAELVDITAERRADAWEYLGMAARFVPADAHRLTVEECEAIAGASGQSFSWCCVCGRRLDNPNSVSRGIGPVCRANQGM